MAKRLSIVVAILLCVAALYYVNEQGQVMVPTLSSKPAQSPVAAVQDNMKPLSPSALPVTPPNSDDIKTVSTAFTFDETAIASLREARVHGDERAPPLATPFATTLASTPSAERPTPDELRDEARYHDYEQRQEMKLKAAFVSAAGPQLKTLNGHIDAMRAHGMSESAIAEALAKRDALMQMNQRLQQMHPELQSPPK